MIYTTPKRGVRFSREELMNLGIALGALTIAFMLLYIRPLSYGFTGYSAIEIGLIFLFSFVAVVTGFLMHEIAHKIVAVRYGLWAEFRASMWGLIFAIFTALFGMVLAAPGAVMISGPISQRRNGIISAAGPLTNLAFGGGFFALFLAIIFIPLEVPYILGILVLQIIQVNLILGVFNMVPVPPLDGSKVWRWKKELWIGLFGILLGLLVSFYALFYLI